MAVNFENITKSETIHLRNEHIGRSCKLFFSSSPLKIVRASAQFMYDENGDEYLDCINNVAHVGHCHPYVVEAGCRQMSLLSTNSRFLHDQIVLLAKRLSRTMPESLSVCFFVNSGSEANDLALRLAKTHTKNKQVITLDHAYHGHLNTMIDISPYKFKLPGGPPQQDWVHVAAVPDLYRGKYRIPRDGLSEEELGKRYAQDVEDICTKLRNEGKGVCAYIAESLQSCGGQIIPPPGYFESVYKSVRAAGGVCIADEVQVGFGRAGTHFWAFQAMGVVPDIVTIGKPMGNGHPVAAVITTKAIAKSFRETGVEYFNTYGGNPVSCAIANAVLDVIQKEHLQQRAAAVGQYLINSARSLATRHPLIGDVRGLGLFVGIELVENRQDRTPATAAAKEIVARMKQQRILISSDGPDENVIKFKPPLVFNERDVDRLMTVMDVVMDEIEEQLGLKSSQEQTITLEVSMTELEDVTNVPDNTVRIKNSATAAVFTN